MRHYATLEESQRRGRDKQRLKGLKRWAPCGHPRTAKTTRYNQTGGGPKCCLICAKEKAQQPNREFFKCGHLKTKDNVLMNAGGKRCKTCHQAQARRWHNPKKPVKPLYAAPTCLLAKVW